MNTPNCDLILSELEKSLTGEEVNDHDCISLYDVKTLVQEKYDNLDNIKMKFRRKMQKIVELKFDDTSNIHILGFDYDEKTLKIDFKMYYTSKYEKIYFSKKNDDLYVNDLSKSPYSQDLLLHLGDILSELYDIYINYKEFNNESYYNKQIINSKMKFSISQYGVDLYWNTGNLVPLKPEFGLNFSTHKKEYEYECNSNKILSFTNGKEEEIFKKTYVKIKDCPKWMQKKLYELRKYQLLNKKPEILVKPKENYDVLLDEINSFLKQETVDPKNTLIEIISAYDLYNIINNELSLLREISLNPELGKKFKKFNFFKGKEHFDVSLLTESNRTHIILGGKGLLTLSIFKDIDTNDIYFDEEENKYNKEMYKFVRKYYDLIMQTFQVLEEYHRVRRFKTKELVLYYDLFKVIMKYDDYGRVKLDLAITKKHKLYDEYSKKWYGRENISDYVERNKDEILKRLPVEPFALPESFKTIYDKYNEKKYNKEKTKTLK